MWVSLQICRATGKAHHSKINLENLSARQFATIYDTVHVCDCCCFIVSTAKVKFCTLQGWEYLTPEPEPPHWKRRRKREKRMREQQMKRHSCMDPATWGVSSRSLYEWCHLWGRRRKKTLSLRLLLLLRLVPTSTYEKELKNRRQHAIHQSLQWMTGFPDAA